MAKAAKPRLTMAIKAAAIAACRDATGRVTPKAVWQAARDTLNPLHKEFNWDLRKAAEREWERTAAQLIREVKFVVTYEERKVLVPYYVSDPKAVTSTYIQTARVARNARQSQSVLREEVSAIVARISRALKLAAAFNLVSSFERMLDEARDVELKLDGIEEEDEARV
jgi:hypothetical protein